MTMIKVREATNWGWVHGQGGSKEDKVENDKINYILNSNRKKETAFYKVLMYKILIELNTWLMVAL